MQSRNDYLATVPFDLYELHLFRLVVKHGSFTKAAEIAGLTQSAITRQIQGMENSLGLALLERTTRRVRATEAGDFLFNEAARLLGGVEHSLQRLREDFGGAKKEVRVGVSRSVALSYLPGFLHANLRRRPEVGCQVAHLPSVNLLSALDANELDLGVLCPPTRLPRTLQVTHRFEDAFTLIAPAVVVMNFPGTKARKTAQDEWLRRQNWLLLSEASNTGRKLRAWMARQNWRYEPAMQLDDFDLIINLVALGLGVSFVPVRALALYGQKHSVKRVPLRERFTRELVVVVRKQRKLPAHLAQFVENILF